MDKYILKYGEYKSCFLMNLFQLTDDLFNKSFQQGLKINDLFVDLRDGILLVKLLEILTDKPIGAEKGKTKIHSLQNISTCLEFLKRFKVS